MIATLFPFLQRLSTVDQGNRASPLAAHQVTSGRYSSGMLIALPA